MRLIFRRPATLGRLLGSGLLLSVTGFGGPLQGQATGFRMPVELLQGFASTDALPVRPYLASAAVVPGYSFTAIRLGLRISADYENPGKTLRFGPRVERQIWEWRANIGVVLGGEATTNFDGHARLGAGLTFDVDGLIRAGFWGGWDESRDGAWFGVTFGADPLSWTGCVESTVNPDNCDGDGQ